MTALEHVEAALTADIASAIRRLRDLRALSPVAAERVRSAGVAELMALTSPASLSELAEAP